MKIILLVAGNLAALKSTVSKRLSKDFNYIVLNKDTIKEVLGDTIGFANREENLKLSKATFQLMKKLAKDVLDTDDGLILESNFKKHELDELFELARMQGYRTLTLMLTGHPDVLYERYVKRDQERHPVHRSTGVLSKEVFEKSMIPYDKSIYGEQSMCIDTTTFDEQDYMKVLYDIRLWMHEYQENR